MKHKIKYPVRILKPAAISTHQNKMKFSSTTITFFADYAPDFWRLRQCFDIPIYDLFSLRSAFITLPDDYESSFRDYRDRHPQYVCV